MLRLTRILRGNRAYQTSLVLPYEDRQKARLKTKLEDGSEAGLFLPRGTIPRGGDLLEAEDGTLVKIIAADEKISRVVCDEPGNMAKVSYHLGNRHVAVEISDNWVAYLRDHVLDDMVQGMGFSVSHAMAPFEPEAGAYAAHEH